jgi:hypothetical protein
VSAISLEHVRFDMQAMQNPDISGIAYQQGELAGYEVREYLLEKWERRCAYCGIKDVPLNVEHICPRSRGGSDRVSNLCLACRRCNEAKGARSIEDFLRDKPDVLTRVLAHAKTPLGAAAAINATRWALVDVLRLGGLPLELASGSRTKFNRFQTGDIVRATVPCGKKAGEHVGRVAVRASGSFNVQTSTAVVQGISWRYCRVLSRGDGYTYHVWARCSSQHAPFLPTAKAGGLLEVS